MTDAPKKPRRAAAADGGNANADTKAKVSKKAKTPALRPAVKDRVVFAIPKGRVLKSLAKRLASIGVSSDVLLADDRTLVRDDPRTGIRFLLLKPDDVPTYVEYGAADVGIVGRDILMEREYDLYAPLDLGIGVCRMVVAGVAGERPLGRTLRVGTKFTNIANRYFLSKGQQIDLVYLQGSVELAPITGLADVIVDLVESGETLKQNGLVELELICMISSVVVANRAALKLKRDQISPIIEALRA